MKKALPFRFLFILIGIAAPLWAGQAQSTFFSDTFNNGSTINSNAPAYPTHISTSYECISSGAQITNISPNDLRYGLSAGGGGGNISEIQALFSTTPIALVSPGDYIQLTIVYTNTVGLFSPGTSPTITAVSCGLYSSGQVLPVAGGTALDGASGVPTSGGAQNWQGYLTEVSTSGSSPHYDSYARAAQTAGVNYAQDVTSQGSSSKSFSANGGVIVAALPANNGLATYPPYSTNLTFTNTFTITELTASSLAISNTLYNSTGLVTATNCVATNTSYLVSSFDALAMGFYMKNDLSASDVVDVASIKVSGSVSTISGPPSITTQPASVLVTTNGSCALSVATSGFDQVYQWHRSGTNLLDGGNISGSTTSQLVISPAGVSDELNSYYVTITGAGEYSTNSTDASLSLVQSTNLVWDANNNNNWNIDTDNNWNPTNTSSPFSEGDYVDFTFGDPVIFSDLDGGATVTLVGSYLSASSVTMSANSDTFELTGSGSFAGPGALYDVGASPFAINNANTYTGGTIISNANAYLVLSNLDGLGTGPITMAEAGGQMEIGAAGNANTEIPNNLVVSANFQIIFDASSNSYSGVFNGDLSGTSGAILTLTNSPGYTAGLDRIRFLGNNTTYNANLDLASSAMLMASYASSTNGQVYNGTISGPGQFMEKGTITYLNGPNTYSGGTTPAQGAIALGRSSAGSPGSLSSGPLGTGPLLLMPDSTTTLTGSGIIMASVPNVTIGNAIQYPSGTNNLSLEIGGANNLTLSGPFTMNGNDGLTTNTFISRTVEVTNTALTTISGQITDGGKAYGLNVFGVGTNANSVLVLNNTETYTGPTTVTDLTLLVNGQIGNGNVTVATNSTLGGTGTIGGAVTVQNSGSLAAGSQAIGTLTINGALTFQAGSTDVVYVSQSSGNSKVTTTSAAYNGTLAPVVTSGSLSAGQNFTIFSSSGTGNFTIAGTPGAGLGWQFTPSSGVLSVISTGPVLPTVPPKITSFSLSANGNVNITGTNGVNGDTYYLLGSASLTTPVNQWTCVATNVVSASGSSGTFNFTGTNVISGSNLFLMLSSTNN
jgi:hypothetical protein